MNSSKGLNTDKASGASLKLGAFQTTKEWAILWTHLGWAKIELIRTKVSIFRTKNMVMACLNGKQEMYTAAITIRMKDMAMELWGGLMAVLTRVPGRQEFSRESASWFLRMEPDEPAFSSRTYLSKVSDIARTLIHIARFWMMTAWLN